MNIYVEKIPWYFYLIPTTKGKRREFKADIQDLIEEMEEAGKSKMFIRFIVVIQFVTLGYFAYKSKGDNLIKSKNLREGADWVLLLTSATVAMLTDIPVIAIPILFYMLYHQVE